jgi:hypothetical protein
MVASRVGVNVTSGAEVVIVAVGVRVGAWVGVIVACSVGITCGDIIKVGGVNTICNDRDSSVVLTIGGTGSLAEQPAMTGMIVKTRMA